jgi:hypothetical protein
MWNYFAFGVACSEVELDTLTGVYRALRCDVVMDVGETLNAALDVGQVEGAFVQGMGLCTTEELVWADAAHRWLPQNGSLFNAGPAYKCPTAIDVPADFRVHLLRDAKCPCVLCRGFASRLHASIARSRERERRREKREWGGNLRLLHLFKRRLSSNLSRMQLSPFHSRVFSLDIHLQSIPPNQLSRSMG